jgi:hypothetical protein
VCPPCFVGFLFPVSLLSPALASSVVAGFFLGSFLSFLLSWSMGNITVITHSTLTGYRLVGYVMVGPSLLHLECALMRGLGFVWPGWEMCSKGRLYVCWA